MTNPETHRRLLIGLSLLVPLSFAACDTPDDIASDEAEVLSGSDDGESAGAAPVAEPSPGADGTGLQASPDPSAVGSETGSAFNGVQRVTSYYDDPLFSANSYASVSIPGCSATLIGPNILMTAAQCGADSQLSITATARAYRGHNLFAPRVETFSCNLLFHTFPETDIAIYHCPNNGPWGGPGDRYGYLDIDHAAVEDDEWLGSVWTNAIGNLGISAASLLSIGHVDAPQAAGHWFNPLSPVGTVDSQCSSGGSPLGVATEMDIWSDFGASGSSHFDLSTGAVRVGPMSTGVAGGLSRNALSMRYYLYWGFIYSPQPTCGRNNTVNASYVSALGLNPSSYTGRFADFDLNWFFDLVEDVEDASGENRHDRYFLGFGNRRRARLWKTGTHASIDTDSGQLDYDTLSSLNSDQELARHDDLNLIAGGRYHVGFDASSTYAHSWYRVCLEGASTTCSGWWKDGVSTEKRRSVMLTAPSGSGSVVLHGWNARGHIEDVQVNRVRLMADPGTPVAEHLLFQDNDFDTFDERQAWFDPANGQPVTVLPDGTGSGTINWSGRVERPYAPAGGYRLELATDGFAFPADDDYEVCFAHRDDPSAPLPGQISGFVRAVDDQGAIVANAVFSPGALWSTRCFSFEMNPGAARNLRLEFGTSGAAGAPWGGAYVLDKVSVEYLAFD